MPKTCIVHGCPNSLPSARTAHVGFHSIPKDKWRRRQWIAVAQQVQGPRKDGLSMMFCELHFTNDDYEWDKNLMARLGFSTKCLRLKKSALPRVNVPSSDVNAPQIQTSSTSTQTDSPCWRSVGTSTMETRSVVVQTDCPHWRSVGTSTTETRSAVVQTARPPWRSVGTSMERSPVCNFGTQCHMQLLELQARRSIATQTDALRTWLAKQILGDRSCRHSISRITRSSHREQQSLEKTASEPSCATPHLIHLSKFSEA